MTLDEWVASCRRDAERRGLPELVSMLDTLAEAARTLRAADWNEDPVRPSAGPEPGGSGAPRRTT